MTIVEIPKGHFSALEKIKSQEDKTTVYQMTCIY